MFIRFLVSAIHKGNETDTGCVPFLFLHVTFSCINNNSWLITNQQQCYQKLHWLYTLCILWHYVHRYDLWLELWKYTIICTNMYTCQLINILLFLCIVIRHAVRLRLTSNFLCHCWTMPKYWIAFSLLLLFIVPAWMQSGEDVPADLDIAGECTWC